MPDPLALQELLTPAEMSGADRFAISAGTPGIALMERAGLAIADEAARLTKSRGRIVVLCGPGGNGGDGFIAARLLGERGYAVELGLLGRRDALKGDPALAAGHLSKAPRSSPPPLPTSPKADCVIDALFGAGLTRDIDGEGEGDHQADQRLQADRGQRARGRRSLRNRRGNRQDSWARGRSERERDLLPAEARPSPGAGPHARRRESGSPTLAFPKPRSPPSRRKPSSMRRPSGATSAAAPERGEPQICPRRRCLSCRARVTTRAQPGSPPARRCG